MSFLKNKFVVIVILAILAGGAIWLYLSSGVHKTKAPVYISSWSGASVEKVGEVIQKLNDFTK